MKIRKCNRMICLLVSLVLCVQMLTGCEGPGGNPGTEIKNDSCNEHTEAEELSSESSDKTQVVRELIYQAVPLEIEMPMQVLDTVVSNGQQTYLYGWDVNSDEEYDLHCSIVRYGGDDTEGTMVHSVDLESGNYTCSSGQQMRPEKMAVTPDGKLAVIFNIGTRELPDQYQMVLFDLDGTELWRVPLENELLPCTTLVCAGGRIYIATKEAIFIFDDKGALQKNLVIEVPEEKRALIDLDSGLKKLHFLEDGRVWLEFVRNGSGNLRGAAFAEMDLETGALLNWTYMFGEYEYFTGTGMEYEMILKGTEGIYGWNLGDTGTTELINFEASAFLAENIDCVNCVAGELLVRYRNMRDEVSVCYLKAMDPDSIAEKQVITMGIFSSRGDYVSEIARFNESSTGYLVRMVDYSDYMEPTTQLNLDLMNGTAPDVIYYADDSSKYELSMADYARQGFLEDLKVWFDNDSDLGREEYLTNVFDALSIDGGWYQLPTAFRVNAYLGHADIFKQGKALTLSEWSELGERYPDKTIMYGSREKLLRDALIFRGTEFTDEETGTCNFDSEEFVELLEWLKQFPESVGQVDANLTRESKIGALSEQLSTFSEINIALDMLFQQQSAFLSFPSAEGSGAIADTEGIVVLAMSAQSDCKEGAWAFIRSYLQDEYQSSLNLFPVKVSALEAEGAEALDPYPETYNPAWKTYPQYKLNGESVQVEYPTEEKIDEWIKYLKSVTYADTLDKEIYNIIVEEAGAFFSGQKTAEEVADIIQSRVWIYLAE